MFICNSHGSHKLRSTLLLKSFVFLTIQYISVLTANADHQKIKIGWVYALANAPIIIATEKNYFKKTGVEVESLPFSSGPLVHQALVAGELDMAYIGAPPVYHWFARGLESRIIAKVNYGQAAVVVRTDSSLKTITDLRNLKLAGVRKGSGMDVLLRGFVLSEYADLNPKTDLRIIPMKPSKMGSALLSNTVDAAFLWEPFTSQFELNGQIRVIFDMNKAIPKYPWYIIMAMPDAIKNNRSGIIKVLQAHKMAIEFLNSSPDAGNKLLAQAFNLQGITSKSGNYISPEQIVKNARKRLGWSYELTKNDSEFIQQLMNYSFQLQFIKKKIKTSDIIDKSFMREALK